MAQCQAGRGGVGVVWGGDMVEGASADIDLVRLGSTTATASGPVSDSNSNQPFCRAPARGFDKRSRTRTFNPDRSPAQRDVIHDDGTAQVANHSDDPAGTLAQRVLADGTAAGQQRPPDHRAMTFDASGSLIDLVFA